MPIPCLTSWARTPVSRLSTKINWVNDSSLSIDEAAERLGVHYMTIYRYIRIGRLPALRVGGRWRIQAPDLARLEAGPTGTEPPAPVTSLTVRRLKDRMMAGDVVGAWTIVESALMAGSPSQVEVGVLGPCLSLIGQEWEREQITVGDEHRATAVALGIMGRLSPMFGRPGRRRPDGVLLAGAEGDPHAIPLAMVADHLRADGFDVIHLGANVPIRTVAAMAPAADLCAVGLSASTTPSVTRAARAIREVRRQIPNLPVLLGGPAVPTEQAARDAGADGWAPDAAEAVGLFACYSQRGARP